MRRTIETSESHYPSLSTHGQKTHTQWAELEGRLKRRSKGAVAALSEPLGQARDHGYQFGRLNRLRHVHLKAF